MDTKIDILMRKIIASYDEEYLLNKKTPTEAEFDVMAEEVRRNTKFEYSDAEFDMVKEQVRETKAACIGLGYGLDKESSEHDSNWFSKYKEEHPDNNKYWARYERYMIGKKNWSEDTIRDLDSNTDDILNRLGNPNDTGTWKRRGLIIGDVQSGKTANYTAVCNKAVDAGYKIIIVLAGRTNTLRKQTQKRLESDFVGRRKKDEKAKKGEILPELSVGVADWGKVGDNQVETFTTSVNDFSKKVADSTSISFNANMMPRLFVVKKVKSVLDNLARWLSVTNNSIDVPMLLIDDEADDASINTKTEDSPTTINQCIRRILKPFSRSTYLAVTATPFANIFIDPFVQGTEEIDKDLFPEDFIYCLPTPSNYIGSEKLFRDDSYKGYINAIKEEDVAESFPFKHKRTFTVKKLPDNLKDAIRYFAITNAVRDIKGQKNTHRSMMINVSRFVDVQNQIKGKVKQFWDDEVMLYVKSYSLLGEKALGYDPICRIKAVFDSSNIEEDYSIEWDDVQKHLLSANNDVRVVSVNQKSSDVIDYEKYENENEKGLKVIAIGGDCLSRGITLEGLSVSYFYRNSKMYDTLMQMGRWFGFRPGYGKLIKVWMASDAIDWYSHISAATEALKLEVFRMNRSKLTPRDFGYMVNGHPDALVPTAKNKMKTAKLISQPAEVDVSGQLIESPRLYNSIDKLTKNYELTQAFIKKVSSSNESNIVANGDVMIKGVEAGDVAAFIQTFQSGEWRMYFDNVTLADFISENDEQWNVFIKNGPLTDIDELCIDCGGKQCLIHAQKRKSSWDDRIIKVSGSRVKVGAGGCTSAGLENYTMDKIKDFWSKLPPELNTKKDGSGLKDIPDEFILHYIDNPILLIHYLYITDENGEALFKDDECKVIALGLGFPADSTYIDSKKNKRKRTKIKFYLNKIAQQISDEEGDDVLYDDL